MKKLLIGSLVSLVSLATLFLASPAFARSISFESAGVALWIFVVIGAAIVLLQLIPAAILFFSFIGTTVAMSKKERVVSEIEGVKEEVTT